MSKFMIASEENMQALAHYGVKGMKWHQKLRAQAGYYTDDLTGKDRAKTTQSYRKLDPGEKYDLNDPDLIARRREGNKGVDLYKATSPQKTTGKYGTFTGKDSKEQYKEASISARERDIYNRDKTKQVERQQKKQKIKDKFSNLKQRIKNTAKGLKK